MTTELPLMTCLFERKARRLVKLKRYVRTNSWNDSGDEEEEEEEEEGCL